MAQAGTPTSIEMFVVNSAGVEVYSEIFNAYLQIPPYCNDDHQMTTIHLQCQARLKALQVFRQRMIVDCENFSSKMLELLRDRMWVVHVRDVRVINPVSEEKELT